MIPSHTLRESKGLWRIDGEHPEDEKGGDAHIES